jgi:hypothetical protein
MKYRYRAVERFWTSFYRLPPAQKESAHETGSDSGEVEMG